MPIYDLTCPECGHKEERFSSVAKRNNQMCSECGTISKVTHDTPINIGDPIRLGITQPSDSFKQVMRDIKANNKGSTIDI